MPIDAVQLSRTMSYALRHQPAKFGLELDDEGWVAVADLVTALRQQRREWSQLQEEDFARVIAQSSKQRYEMKDGLIRAAYGHSIKQKVSHERAVPPALLFHGTTPEAYASIRLSGLKSMGRQFVHLSEDRGTARQVALRRTRQPVILCIDTQAAFQAGIAFYTGTDKIWLTDFVPPYYLRKE